MKNLKRTILMILALMTAICLSIAAFAEDAAEAPAAETASADAAQASADALNEALTAYSNAKMESRKQESLDALKQELDSGGHGGRGGRGNGFGGGKGGRNGMGFGGGRDGRFGQQPGTVQNAPADPGEPAPEGSGV